jgi:hypothetical protein
MAELHIHHITVMVYTEEGEEVDIFTGMPEHPTTATILETIAEYHGFDDVEDLCKHWSQ